jgi:2'-5' RNA ligase
MINMNRLLLEKRNSSVDRGCLMAMIDGEFCHTLIKYNKRLVPEDILYKEGSEFGREEECHITIKYGFLPDLNELQIREILKGQKPFSATLKKLNIFQNDPFDVVKFEVESDVLRKLNEKSSKFPNDDKYPQYNPHMTLAYVQKGSFPFTKDVNIVIPISSVCYSPIKGSKSYFDL